MTTPTLLSTLYRSGQLRTLDHALAHTLQRLDPYTPDSVQAAAALASLAISKGHAGLMLARPRDLLESDLGIAWPDPLAWQEQLSASAWVATPDAPADIADASTPLVLEHGLLYLRRYREYERRLAIELQRIGAHPAAPLDPTMLAPLFTRMFPQAQSGEDRQAHAAALALYQHLLLVTGGPGTGKTSTITRMLALLVAQSLQQARPAPRIALAAPTGRAAERMAESVRAAVQALTAAGIEPELLAQLPTTGTTLHRLLGSIPDSPRFRHHAGNRLGHDIVVVDEASMIDLPLMAKLAEAIPDGGRLILLGDPDQLPSVEAGDVLAGILAAAGSGDPTADAQTSIEHLSAADASHGLRPDNADPVATCEAHFSGRRIHLLHGWRQSAALQLAPLADAVRRGDADSALALLHAGQLANVHFHAGALDPLQAGGKQLLEHWSALATAADPAHALAQSSRLRLLTALREGPQGARRLNARIEAVLLDAPLDTAHAGRSQGGRHFHGRLLLITENSYRHRLFNGDIGICLRDPDGVLVAWFPGDNPQQPRAFHPSTLPAHESAFAMTVHKAQGSEFDNVWLLLPARDNRVLSRELVYTGITRARQTLQVVADPAVLHAALARHVSRTSGLGWRLGAAAALPAPPLAGVDVSDGVQGDLF